MSDKFEFMTPVDLSLEAALELEEVKQGLRSDAPSLVALFELLRTPAPGFSGSPSVSMLNDMRAYPLLRDSLGERVKIDYTKFEEVVGEYFCDLEEGIKAHDLKKIEEAKRFCLAFNTGMLARQMNEVYRRRDRPDARTVSNDTLPQLKA
jgi:hypothetical protein